MAFLAPHFDPDVFVSYSHGDPRGVGVSPLKAWTHKLIARLKAQIESLEDEFDGLDVFYDGELDPTARLTEAIKAKVDGSGVLIIVMSKRYLGSAWCRDESEWFAKQYHDHARRVFVLRAQETDAAQWPDFLRDERGAAMTGFKFYDPATGFPLGWTDGAEPGGEFLQAVSGLQTALTRRLRELRARANARAKAEPPTPAAPAGSPRRVYLHASPESETLRADIQRALSGEGILPLTAHPTGAGSLSDWQREAGARIETAKRCEALALLRADESERFIGDLLDIGVDERERIAAARGASLPCAVLDNTGEALPVDVSPYGIARFDVHHESWRADFRAWLDSARRAAP